MGWFGDDEGRLPERVRGSHQSSGDCCSFGFFQSIPLLRIPQLWPIRCAQCSAGLDDPAPKI